MRFFDREREKEILREVEMLSHENAQFTVITGRRRVGKTWLVTHTYNTDEILYFFVGRKSEAELCKGFRKEIEEKLHIPVLGDTYHFSDIFEFVMKYAMTNHVTLFIDEFQDFIRVNKSVFSDIQRIWDLYKEKAKINLLVGGSINTLLTKIFKNNKEPLFGRQCRFMNIKPFRIAVLKEILHTYNPDYSADDLLTLYMLTGGIAKYVSTLMDNKSVTAADMITRVISEESPYIAEGKNVLLEEFGKDSGVYFSIMSAIASGKNTRNEIESAVGKEVGGYLTNLEEEYNLISKQAPFLSKSKSKNIHYELDDAFYRFWFRFIHKYNFMVEIGKFENLREIIRRDYTTFSGHVLERYFRQKISEEEDITRIGSWWDRKGENEIDIITENELSDTITFYEVKREKDNIQLGTLRRKSEAFFTKVRIPENYEINYRPLSLEDM